MPELRLTKKIIELLPYPPAGQVLYRDSVISGFGVRVSARSKAYFVEGGVDGQNIRATLGRADLMAPELARKKALDLPAFSEPGDMSIRLRQGLISAHFRLSRSKAFAMTMSLRMIAVRASLAGFPTWMS